MPEWLERSGCLDRVLNPRDRRSSLLRPTRWGIGETVNQILPLAAEVRSLLVENHSEEERAVLGRFLEATTTAYARQAQGGSSEEP